MGNTNFTWLTGEILNLEAHWRDAGHCPAGPNIVRSGVSRKDFELGGSLERCRTLSGWAGQDPARGVCFESVEKDLA
jgi:hypothetical protein